MNYAVVFVSVLCALFLKHAVDELLFQKPESDCRLLSESGRFGFPLPNTVDADSVHAYLQTLRPLLIDHAYSTDHVQIISQQTHCCAAV